MMMLEFSCTLAAFFVSHRLPAHPTVRQRLVARMGERAYRGVYGVVSIAVMVWLIAAAMRAPVITVWWPQPWHVAAALAVMPLALVLITAGALSPNPMSVSLRSLPYNPARPGVVSITRHPMLWGFALWALSHAIANPDVAALIMFCGLGLFALHGMRVLDARTRARLGDEEWCRLAAGTSTIPFAAVLSGRGRLDVDRRLLLGLVIGIALYILIVAVGHELIIGVDPIARVAL